MTFNQLLSKIESAPRLDFGDIFSKSIELFKKVWVQGLVMMLLMIACLIPFYIVVYVPLIAAVGLESMVEPSGNPDFSAIGVGMVIYLILAYLLFIVAISVVSYGLVAAFMRICRNKDLESGKNDDYFFYLKKPYLRKTIKMALTVLGIMFAIMILVYAILGGGMALLFSSAGEEAGFAFMPILFLAYIPILYILPIQYLVYAIYPFNTEMTPMEVIKAAIKLGHKKWWITFGLIIVSTILAFIIGGVLCVIGIFLTMSFVYLPVYFVYKDAIGFDDTDAIDKIGETDNVEF